LIPLILEEVKALKAIKNESSFNNSEELKALRKVNEEISNFIYENNVLVKEDKRKIDNNINTIKKGRQTWIEGGTRECKECNLYRADLSGVDLSNADLSGAFLLGADLRGANLRDTDLRGADLREADLREADLFGAKLSGADLREATLCNTRIAKGIDDSGCTQVEVIRLAKERKAEAARIAEEKRLAKIEKKAEAARIAENRAAWEAGRAAREAERAKEAARKMRDFPFKAEILCEMMGSTYSLFSCFEELSITINSIQKTYTFDDLVNNSNDENMKNCDMQRCTIDLPQQFKIRARHNKDNDSMKLILRILSNGNNVGQQSTSSAYKWITIYR